MFLKALLTTICVALCGALVLDAAGAATDGLGGQVRGRTTQKRTIKLALRGRTVQLKHFTARLRCRGGDVLIDTESGFQPTPVRGGRFDDVQVGSTDEVMLRGRMRGGRVTGKVRVLDRLGKKKCDSGWIGFSAR